MASDFGVYQRANEPAIPLPVGAFDCQAHIYGSAERYPAQHQGPYEPPPATIDDLHFMHDTLGVENGLLVQAATYGADHSLLLDVLEESGNRYVGCCVMDLDWGPTTLARLDQAGVRAARFALASFLRTSWTIDDVLSGAAIAADLGWLVKVLLTPDQILAHADVLLGVDDVTMVLDHMGYVDVGLGVEQPAMDVVGQLLEKGNWWVMLSCGDRLSQVGSPWPDAAAVVAYLAQRWPHRVVWGSDWPHAMYRGDVPNDADTVDMVSKAMPDDSVRERLFVTNPAEMFEQARG